MNLIQVFKKESLIKCLRKRHTVVGIAVVCMMDSKHRNGTTLGRLNFITQTLSFINIKMFSSLLSSQY